MTLTPFETRFKITLLKQWVINDPDGKWRDLRRTESEETCRFEALDSWSGAPLHSFILPHSHSQSRWWVEQDKDQWIIAEYIDDPPIASDADCDRRSTKEGSMTCTMCKETFPSQKTWEEHEQLHRTARAIMALLHFARENGYFMALSDGKRTFTNMEAEK